MRVGDSVIWEMHPAKPKGVIEDSVYRGFYDIRLIDPPKGQSERVRLTKYPLRKAVSAIGESPIVRLSCSGCSTVVLTSELWRDNYMSRACRCGGRLK